MTSLLSRKCKNVITVDANSELNKFLKKIKENNVLFVNKYITNNSDKVVFQPYDIVVGSGDIEDKVINNVRGWGDSLKTYDIDIIDLIDISGIKNINAMMLDMEDGEYIFLQTYIEFIKSNIKKLCLELHGHQMKVKDLIKMY